jgi:dynein heavy chain
MYARKTHIAIDTLDFKMHVESMREFGEVKAPPEDGVFIYGMFLVCARWDAGVHAIAEMEPGRLLYRLPVCRLEPVAVKEYNVLTAERTYPCPFYKTSKRAGVLRCVGGSARAARVAHAPPGPRGGPRADADTPSLPLAPLPDSTTGHSTNFVMTVGLPSQQAADHWIRRGTAVLSEDELGLATW